MDLSEILKNGANPAIGILSETNLSVELSDIINNHKNKKAPLLDFSNIVNLINYYDYRLVAEYLWAIKNDEKRLQTLERLYATRNIDQANKYLYMLACQRFIKKQSKKEISKVTFVKIIDKIFNSQKKETLVYLYDRKYKNRLESLLSDIDGLVNDFIEQQYDVPGRNALIRNGIVKTWNLPDGTPIISKRQNSQKPDRFQMEQLNHIKIIKNQSISFFTAQDLNIKIAHPFAVVNDTGVKYSLFERVPGKTLEEVLYKEKNQLKRIKYL